MQKILIVQTAFIGDVVLATGLLEKLHATYPSAAIDFLVRKGNESLFIEHPFLHEVLVWDKKQSKYKQLFRIILLVRKKKYDLLINVQRFAATGLLTILSNAKQTVGFNKNPFSFFFNKSIKHIVSNGKTVMHEIERNHLLIKDITDDFAARPKLYPTIADTAFVQQYKQQPYICIAPASVWFTKQFAVHKWIELINALPGKRIVYLLGAPSDKALCATIQNACVDAHIEDLSGKLSFLQSAALMKDAFMNYVNDSAPMHFASAVNAPVTAIYCSTLPAFGFGPLSDRSFIIEVQEKLDCRPCGLHGKKACPRGHFNCANKITNEQLLKPIANN
ncbi:MAG: glycosyltransferase family 9 protein [Sphingobacteriia bacterium]|nr:glycosyltransferase family 9 protein [Sphingobacteriia bacterium]